MSEGIVVSGCNIYEIRNKLGIFEKEFYIRPSGDMASPVFYAYARGESKTFSTIDHATEWLGKQLKDHFKPPKKQKKAKARRKTSG